MKRASSPASRLFFLGVPVFAALTVFCLAAAAQPPIQTGAGHRFACTDYSGNKVFLVGADGKVEWEYATGTCNDLWALPNGNLLFNTGHGVLEVDRDKKTVFSYESKSEVYACQRLENGNTFIGECNAGRLIEVDPAGAVVFELRILPEGKDGGHAYMATTSSASTPTRSCASTTPRGPWSPKSPPPAAPTAPSGWTTATRWSPAAT